MRVAFLLAVFLLPWFDLGGFFFCQVGMGRRLGVRPYNGRLSVGADAGPVEHGWCRSLALQERTGESGALAAAGTCVVFVMEKSIWEIPVLDSFIRFTNMKPLEQAELSLNVAESGLGPSARC